MNADDAEVARIAREVTERRPGLMARLAHEERKPLVHADATEQVRLVVLEAQRRAWEEGYQTCCGDFDIAARAEARSANPYR